MSTIHRVPQLTLADLNRTLELIQKQTTNKILNTPNISSSSPSGGVGVSSASVGPVGPQGATGPAGADGSVASMLVGANHQVEVLVGPTGDVLTDEWGLALMGVNVTSTVITGAGSVSIEVLNAS